jgi:hypothetical protein
MRGIWEGEARYWERERQTGKGIWEGEARYLEVYEQVFLSLVKLLSNFSEKTKNMHDETPSCAKVFQFYVSLIFTTLLVNIVIALAIHGAVHAHAAPRATPAPGPPMPEDDAPIFCNTRTMCRCCACGCAHFLCHASSYASSRSTAVGS